MSTKLRFIMASLVLALVACGDDDDTGPNQDPLVGTWEATEAEVVSVADPQTSEELISQGGTLTVELNANGTFSLDVTFPGEAPQAVNGTWSATQDVLTLNWTGLPITWEFDFALVADVLTVTGADTEWDFGTGDEAATLNAVLARQ
jgi:hypothetical protein